MPRKRRTYKRDARGRFARTGGGGGPKALGRTTRAVHIPASGAAVALNTVAAASGSTKAQKRLISKLLGRAGSKAKSQRVEGTVTVTGDKARYVVTVRRDPHSRHKSKKAKR